MGRERWLEVLVAVSLGAALLAAAWLITGSLQPRAPVAGSDSRPRESTAATPVPRAGSPPGSTSPVAGPTAEVAPGVAAPPQAVPQSGPEVPDAGPAVQPSGSYAEFADDEDRQESLLEMRKQRFRSGMDALNERARRRAANARPLRQAAESGPRPRAD